jgi:tetratricopeptide (TPR) repeat protein
MRESALAGMALLVATAAACSSAPRASPPTTPELLAALTASAPSSRAHNDASKLSWTFPAYRPLPARSDKPWPAYLLEPPAWMANLRDTSANIIFVDARGMHVPPPPWSAANVPEARRPSALGQPLVLAELALARGDAFDAQFQFRELITRARHDDLPYLELQLGRAYQALGRLDDAQRVLEAAVARGTPAAWPAVFELVTLLVRDRGADPFETWRRFATVAPELEEELAYHVIPLATDPAKVARFATTVRLPASELTWPCLNTLRAFEASPPHGLPSWHMCPVKAASPIPSQSDLDFVGHIARGWRLVAGDSPEDEGKWMQLGDMMIAHSARTPGTPAAVLASWLGLLAFQNAANVAAQRGQPYVVNPIFHADAYAYITHAHPDFQDAMRRTLDSFLQVQP